MPDTRLQEDVLLAEYSTFQLGGPCRILVECPGEDSLISVVTALQGTPFILIGGGSNILFSDGGYDGWIVRYCCREPEIRREGSLLEVSGATSLDSLAGFAVESGLGGLVNTSGIPGTVGGAVVGNAGAWGWQIGDAVKSVRLIDRNGVVHEARAEELQFAYRHSRLKQSDEIVLSVTLELEEQNPSDLAKQRADILALRAGKHPDLDIQPCIGSIFKNIEPSSSAERRQAAGYFLEQVGVKQLKVGGAEVFARHANIIVKGEGCTSQQVHDLSLAMATAVRDQLGLELVREVRFLGVFDGAECNDGFF